MSWIMLHYTKLLDAMNEFYNVILDSKSMLPKVELTKWTPSNNILNNVIDPLVSALLKNEQSSIIKFLISISDWKIFLFLKTP